VNGVVVSVHRQLNIESSLNFLAFSLKPANFKVRKRMEVSAPNGALLACFLQVLLDLSGA